MTTSSTAQAGRIQARRAARGSAMEYAARAGFTARGVIYLPFSFEGAPCRTQHHVQRDTSGCYTGVQQMARDVNAQVRRLAAVLNAPFADGYVTAGRGIDAMAKAAPDGHYYVFAGNKDNASKTATFAVKGITSGAATVVGEKRSVPIAGGSFHDDFADGNAIHIYRIGG
jgi:hypothetical protein